MQKNPKISKKKQECMTVAQANAIREGWRMDSCKIGAAVVAPGDVGRVTPRERWSQIEGFMPA
jgi:hypothetical protein